MELSEIEKQIINFEEKHINPKFGGKQLIQKKVCMQKDIGVLGNLFGGNLLSWIDESAAGFISEAIGFRPIVTLKISEVLFKAPVKLHDVININCTIKHIGKTSILVSVEVMNTHSKRVVYTCDLVFVHVDSETMKPKEI